MSPFDRDRLDLEFDEQFAGSRLDPDRWVDHYVPQWTTPERSRTRYDVVDGVLRLRIDADQPPWSDDEGTLRVSGFQSGSWSGQAGSTLGQHRHGTGHIVRTPQQRRALYTPSGGTLDVRLRASRDPTTMLAAWTVGFEDDSPDHSGEICIVELFGNAIGDRESTINTGIKAHHDPSVRDDMVTLALPIDASGWHTYGATWNEHVTHLLVDGEVVHTVPQGFAYPMQLMVALFEFPASPTRDPAAYPKSGEVGRIRGFIPR